ncbi:MAG: chromate transporter [Eubacteriaceae bacterium]|nr:chromate transporter [Eubacteriaceae bacterium]
MAEMFWVFFRIGLVSFGGGYAMVSLFVEEITGHGWMNAESVFDFVAVSYSTPGPFSVNMATFVGAKVAGAAGAAASTLGLILPSFLILTAVSQAVGTLPKSKAANAALKALRAVVVALVAAAAISALKIALFSSTGGLDIRSCAIFAMTGAFQALRKKTHPILLIGIGCVLGLLLYGFIGRP